MGRFNRGNLKIWGLKAKTWASVWILLMIILNISLIGIYAKNRIRVAEAQGAYNQISQARETLIETPTTEQQQIISYIKEVFGPSSSKAFQVLSCENKALNPNAFHDNEKWGQGLGRDWGVFQINDHWQGVSGRFLKNWKVNVEVAYQIYKESGYNFHLWTCGRRIGI